MALSAFEFLVLKPLPADKHMVLVSGILGLERDWVPQFMCQGRRTLGRDYKRREEAVHCFCPKPVREQCMEEHCFKFDIAVSNKYGS